MSYIFGLDIGIASVGWAVVDENYEVIESGSNLFSAAEASSNVERRGFRQGKRLKRRQKTRIGDFIKLWKNQGLAQPKETCNEVLELRNKGLSEKLTEEEIFTVLLNMLKHRGISYLEDALEDGSTGGSNYERAIAINQEELKKKLPCQIQYERLQKYGHYRGDINVTDDNGEKITLSNVFTTGAYKNELKQFFKVQKKYHSVLSDKFEEDYMKIFGRKREYYEGPGNELSRTDYGKYTTKINPETGEYITEENIFEKLIGRCSVYKDQLRAAAATYTAQEFNALNDLNNLVINERKLTEEEKREIIEKIKTTAPTDKGMTKVISKVIKEEIESISGARIDKSENDIFHRFEQYNKMRKELEKINVDICNFSREELDEIGYILTINTEREAIVKAVMNSSVLDLSEEILDCFISLRKKNGSLFKKWHSFSVKIMEELIPVLYEQPKNQMQILTEMGVFKSKGEIFKECKEIPKNLITEEIYNPVVCRSIRISVDIINALIKKYGAPDQIVIEMPRDKNTEEEQKRIKDFQKNREKELNDIIMKISSEYGINNVPLYCQQHKKLDLKLKLWNEQDRRCLYSGKEIYIEDLLKNPDMFEIDHIIPKSISFDDSRSNKVLVYRSENQDKGVQTPFMYLSNINREWGYDQFKSYVLGLKLNKAKRDKLLFTENINKIDVLKGFINRNINDTRYASRVILNTLQTYFREKETGTKIKVIRGSFTSQMRKNFKLAKDREESYSHHAVDAMLICFSQMGYDAYKKLQDECIDFETGEIINEDLWKECDEKYEEILYNKKWKTIKDNIVKAEKEVKYWHKVDRKCNRGLCNQTIYGTRNLDGRIEKISKLNIYTDDGIKKFRNLIEKGKESSFLMYRNDPVTFRNLMTVYEQYKDAKNPFVEYEKETGDFVRKYAKKHNGAKITNLKYANGEVNSCIDISHKYGHERDSKKVVLDSLNPYRMDVYYKPEDGYYFIGIKYSDIKCEGRYYVIDKEAYTKTILNEKMIKEGQTIDDLESLGFEFRLSFYKDEFIEYEKDGKIYVERFLSRTMPKKRNYIETKPIEKSKFEKRSVIGLANSTSIRKINVDILGNRYSSDREKFKLIVDKI